MSFAASFPAVWAVSEGKAMISSDKEVGLAAAAAIALWFTAPHMSHCLTRP